MHRKVVKEMIANSVTISKDHIESKQLYNEIDSFDNNALEKGESMNNKVEENRDLIPYLSLASKEFKTFSQRLVLKDIFEPNSYRLLIKNIKIDNRTTISLYPIIGFYSVTNIGCSHSQHDSNDGEEIWNQ